LFCNRPIRLTPLRWKPWWRRWSREHGFPSRQPDRIGSSSSRYPRSSGRDGRPKPLQRHAAQRERKWEF